MGSCAPQTSMVPFDSDDDARAVADIVKIFKAQVGHFHAAADTVELGVPQEGRSGNSGRWHAPMPPRRSRALRGFLFERPVVGVGTGLLIGCGRLVRRPSVERPAFLPVLRHSFVFFMELPFFIILL